MRLKPTEEEIAKHATEKDLKRYKRLEQTEKIGMISTAVSVGSLCVALVVVMLERSISVGILLVLLFPWLISVPAAIWNVTCQAKIDEFERRLPLTDNQYRKHLESTHPGSKVVEAPGGEIWVFTGRFASEAEDGTKYIYERSRDQLEEREKD